MAPARNQGNAIIPAIETPPDLRLIQATQEEAVRIVSEMHDQVVAPAEGEEMAVTLTRVVRFYLNAVGAYSTFDRPPGEARGPHQDLPIFACHALSVLEHVWECPHETLIERVLLELHRRLTEGEVLRDRSGLKAVTHIAELLATACGDTLTLEGSLPIDDFGEEPERELQHALWLSAVVAIEGFACALEPPDAG